MGVSGFASSGTTKAASALRSAARTPKHRRSSEAMPDHPRLPIPLNEWPCRSRPPWKDQRNRPLHGGGFADRLGSESFGVLLLAAQEVDATGCQADHTQHGHEVGEPLEEPQPRDVANEQILR
jgi:hypothetical protein